MPELPEVETVVRGLNREVKGLTVGKVEYIARHLSKNDPQLSRLSGDTILGFSRRGK
jgi:formamidopyrimidine-DNA glycosylase